MKNEKNIVQPINPEYTIGQKVHHNTFGNGIISSVSDKTIKVIFDDENEVALNIDVCTKHAYLTDLENKITKEVITKESIDSNIQTDETGIPEIGTSHISVIKKRFQMKTNNINIDDKKEQTGENIKPFAKKFDNTDITGLFHQELNRHQIQLYKKNIRT